MGALSDTLISELLCQKLSTSLGNFTSPTVQSPQERLREQMLHQTAAIKFSLKLKSSSPHCPHLPLSHPVLFLQGLSNSYLGGHSSLANTPRPRLYWLGTYHTSPFYDSFSVHMLTILDNRCPYTSRYNCSQTCPMLPRGQSTPQTALS